MATKAGDYKTPDGKIAVYRIGRWWGWQVWTDGRYGTTVDTQPACYASKRQALASALRHKEPR